MDIQELLDKRSIKYLPKGRDLVIRCLNPEHEDKNPSMRIDRISGVYNCLSCGFKGNLFDYFGQKVNILGRKRSALKDKIQQKLAENIGLDIPENAIPFDQEWRGIKGETFLKFEAFQHNHPDFIGRVVFPVRSISNKISGFIGRHMTANFDPKYLVKPTQAKLPLYPSKPAQIDGRIILVEGILDVLNLYDKGLDNATCAFGTRKLLAKDKREAINKLALFKLQGVIGIDIFMDGDEAGQKAAEELKFLCDEDFDIRNVYFNGKDPGDLTALQVIKLKETLYG